jgi:hypothetical protein
MKPLFQPLACLIALCSLAATLRADEFIVDQRHEFDPTGMLNEIWLVNDWTTPGVDFTPALNSLDFIDLLTQAEGSPPGTLQALILRGSTVVGGSDLLNATNVAPATNRFRFYPSVPLSPGSNYVIQLRTLDTWWGVLGNSTLFFREGTVVPAPIPPPLSIHVSYVDVCWSSRAGTNYQVQYRSDMTTNVWTDLGSPILGNGITNCVTDAIAGPRKFYRVKILP